MKFCSACGIQLNDVSVVCPSCGEGSGFNNNTNLQHMSSQAQYNQLRQTTQINKYVLTGFILGVISWFINLAGIVGILAVVFSGLGLSRIRSEEKGKGLAIIGLASGIVNVIYAFVIICSLL